ncbi:MAG: hypothetical protein NT118_09210, partial [Lentisphaerae bacterium]|nr:hypothetical protein [Lentisphaerota bacterium]
GTYEKMWIEKTVATASTDAKLADKLDEGLYMFFYGVEGAGAGNDTAADSKLSAVPFVVHVASSEKLDVLANLKPLGILDDTQKAAIEGVSIGIVAVASLSNPDEAGDGDYNITLLAREQLEILAKIAGNSGISTYTTDVKYSNATAKQITITLDSGREINVVSAVFVK